VLANKVLTLALEGDRELIKLIFDCVDGKKNQNQTAKMKARNFISNSMDWNLITRRNQETKNQSVMQNDFIPIFRCPSSLKTEHETTMGNS